MVQSGDPFHATISDKRLSATRRLPKAVLQKSAFLLHHDSR
jgi:hypothetical protein